jgi:hypothetical protein
MIPIFLTSVGAASVQDQTLGMNPDQAIEPVWPNLQTKPSKDVVSCREQLYKLTGVQREARFLYESQYMSFCRFNEYRMSMYLECAQTLGKEIKTASLNTIPSFCNHAQGFSKNDYKSYTGCLSKIYSNTDLYGGFVSSVCEQSKGKTSVVDCIIDSIGRGKGQTASLQQLQTLDACLKI